MIINNNFFKAKTYSGVHVHKYVHNNWIFHCIFSADIKFAQSAVAGMRVHTFLKKNVAQ